MPLADRRLASRFEIVGKQWGVLDALEPLRVRNLSAEGMLLECPDPLAVGSVHEFQLIDGTTSVRVRAAVRHLSPLRQSSAERVLPGRRGVRESRHPIVFGNRAVAQRTVRAADPQGGLRWSLSSANAAAHRVSQPNAATIAALHVSVPVRVLDLSPAGLMLACEAPLRVGSTVRFVTRLAGRRLEVELCLRHVSRRRDEEGGGYVFGGSFPSFDATARQTIDALLGENGLRPAGEPAPRTDD